LAAALRLQRRGLSVLLIEASDAPGGRIRTDTQDGFLLDRGFQVLLDSYPIAREVLDYKQLDLKPFLPGALVRLKSGFHELTDPWRQPLRAFKSLFSPVGSLADKLRVAKLKAVCNRGTLKQAMQLPETTTLADLQSFGFSAAFITQFFHPFLGGIFLDPSLETTSRMFRFVFRLFGKGLACLPATGMEAIPRQLAAKLAPGTLRCNSPVVEVQAGGVTLATGEQIAAKVVIVATEGPSAAKLLSSNDVNTAQQAVRCLYFRCTTPPTQEPILVLNGTGTGPINNLCVPSLVAPQYAPAGQHLISVTVLDIVKTEAEVQSEVQHQLREWYGPTAAEWQHLRSYTIPYALPRQPPGTLTCLERPVRVRPGLYVCGDHRDNASINGALASGHRAADVVLADGNLR
jgi:phytoene dehydrogenase-like protein